MTCGEQHDFLVIPGVYDTGNDIPLVSAIIVTDESAEKVAERYYNNCVVMPITVFSSKRRQELGS